MSWTSAQTRTAGRPLSAGPALRSAGSALRSSGPGPGLRLTRRGRAVLLLALVTLLLAAFSLGRVGPEAAPTAAKAPAPLEQTVVQPGETLWAVAKRVAPGHDPRGVIDRIADLNDLDSDSVRAGQLLVLPR